LVGKNENKVKVMNGGSMYEAINNSKILVDGDMTLSGNKQTVVEVLESAQDEYGARKPGRRTMQASTHKKSDGAFSFGKDVKLGSPTI